MDYIRKCIECKHGVWDMHDPGWIACLFGIDTVKVKPDTEACRWFECEEDDDWDPDHPFSD